MISKEAMRKLQEENPDIVIIEDTGRPPIPDVTQFKPDHEKPASRMVVSDKFKTRRKKRNRDAKKARRANR